MKTFNILDYGKPKNITNAVKAALEDIRNSGEQAILIFPENKYHFFKEDSETRIFHTSNTDSRRFPEKKIAFLIEDIENLTVDGCGSEFIVHGDMMFLAAIRCKNITFKNFSWDYPSPTTVEMKTVKIGRNYADFVMPPEQEWEIKGKDIIWYEKSPKTGEIYWSRKNLERTWGVCRLDLNKNTLVRAGLPDSPFTANRLSVEKLDERKVRIKYLGFVPKSVGEGIVFVICPNKDRSTAGAFFWESSDIRAENIRPLYLHGFSWLVQMCKNVSFKNCRFVPKKEKERYITSFADSVHVAGASGYIHIVNCDFSHSLDDPINIHGSFMRVEKLIDSHTAKLIYCHHQQGGFKQFHKGDKVAFYDRKTLIGVEDERLFTVESVAEPTESESCFEESAVTFIEELPKYLEEKIGNEGRYVAENVTYSPDVTIRNCRFSHVPTRGILCTARGKVLIENNEFYGMTMASIYISNDSDLWYESGPVRDMTIRKNTFYVLKPPINDFGNKGGIFIDPITKGGKLPDEPIHKNITIDSNTFYMEHDNAVYARSVENLTVINNVIKVFDTENAEKDLQPFRFEKCRSVKLDGNTVSSFSPNNTETRSFS